MRLLILAFPVQTEGEAEQRSQRPLPTMPESKTQPLAPTKARDRKPEVLISTQFCFLKEADLGSFTCDAGVGYPSYLTSQDFSEIARNNKSKINPTQGRWVVFGLEQGNVAP